MHEASKSVNVKGSLRKPRQGEHLGVKTGKVSSKNKYVFTQLNEDGPGWRATIGWNWQLVIVLVPGPSHAPHHVFMFQRVAWMHTHTHTWMNLRLKVPQECRAGSLHAQGSTLVFRLEHFQNGPFVNTTRSH